MDILQKFREIISQSEKPIVFEFGMCDGYHSNILLNILSENGKPFIYHGCEPVKQLHDGIILNYRNGKAQKHNFALGSEDKIVDFYKSGGERIENGVVMDRYYGSSSIRKPKLVTEAWKSMTFEKESVTSITFDNFKSIVGLKDEVIDFIWADIQGAEVDMIQGGSESFKKVRYLYTEYNNSELYEGEIGLDGICNMLPDFEVIYDFKGDVLLKNKNYE